MRKLARKSERSAPAAGRFRRFVRRAVRWTLLGTVLSVAFVGWYYHRARAQMSENFYGLGENLMEYSGARHQDAPRDLVLNEQVIRLSSGTTDHSMHEVLDVFEARCADADAELMEQSTLILDRYPLAGSAGEARDLGHQLNSMREEAAGRGWVACLHLGQSSVPLSEMMDRIHSFNATGNLAEIGEMRFVFAEEDDELGTHFVALWTVGDFNIVELFPPSGDAPGDDVPGVPRPRRSRRLISAYERGFPQSVTMYESEDDESTVDLFYRRQLRQEGWALLPTQPVSSTADVARTLFFERGERMVTVAIATDSETGNSRVGIFDSRRGAFEGATSEVAH